MDVKNVANAWDNKGDIIIGNDVWIGYEAIILAGVTIGNGAVIGTRAVVRLAEKKDCRKYRCNQSGHIEQLR
ncbi:MAG: acetyltransferase [Caproiciproducens sp.]|nr:acetyltransferase [Caproiciproducens sp.]